MNTFLPLIGGLLLLIVGGDLLVRGAVKAATILRVSPLVIGLTLVGFGTSSPELVTSIQASLAGSPAIAVGNIVGSNIANVLLILGIAALLSPIAVSSAAIKRDGGVMLSATLLFAALCWLGTIDRIIGIGFVVLLIGYIVFSFLQERQVQPAGHGAAYEKGEAARGVDQGFTPAPGGNLWLAVLIALAGLVLVVFGGNFLVSGATALARDFGISEAVIGLTIVAVGTSMPELVTSIVAALRGQSDVAIGNVVGSNIYNVLGIGGITAIVSPLEVPDQIVSFDNPYMIAATVLFLGFAWTGMRIGRREGALLLACYALYIFSLWPK